MLFRFHLQTCPGQCMSCVYSIQQALVVVTRVVVAAVVVVAASRSRRRRLPVLLDGAVHQLEQLGVQRPHVAHRRAPDGAEEPRRREQVGDAEPARLPLRLAQRLQELLPPSEAALPHDGAQRQVGKRPGDLPAHVHRRRLIAAGSGGGGGDGANEAGDLLLPDGAERAHPPRVEELEAADPAEAAPPLAVRREEYPHRVADGVPHRDAHGAGGERGVVRPQDLPGGVPRRGHHDGELAEAEVHDAAAAAAPPREVGQRAVHRLRVHGEVVQAADDGEPPWPRRQPRAGGGVLATTT
ncbi:Os06g0671375 [Oryza sativa Japonica Group]|uniref:Os06g0671375 protein n=1 Tax=Oryza sativa subsp. japonica TaxID=39947 RepID=A0A0P0X0B4_ORYSJ|nr:hypothetical protein EE612_035973 [Oryza sativa]BAS99080.1 Os06g0671375 [Oryza sativa Japonica Group]